MQTVWQQRRDMIIKKQLELKEVSVNVGPVQCFDRWRLNVFTKRRQQSSSNAVEPWMILSPYQFWFTFMLTVFCGCASQGFTYGHSNTVTACYQINRQEQWRQICFLTQPSIKHSLLNIYHFLEINCIKLCKVHYQNPKVTFYIWQLQMSLSLGSIYVWIHSPLIRWSNHGNHVLYIVCNPVFRQQWQ